MLHQASQQEAVIYFFLSDMFFQISQLQERIGELDRDSNKVRFLKQKLLFVGEKGFVARCPG